MVAAVLVKNKGKFSAVLRQGHGTSVGEKKGERGGGVEDFPVLVVVNDPAHKRPVFSCDIKMLSRENEKCPLRKEAGLLGKERRTLRSPGLDLRVKRFPPAMIECGEIKSVNGFESFLYIKAHIEFFQKIIHLIFRVMGVEVTDQGVSFLVSQIVDGPGLFEIGRVMDTAVKDSILEDHPFGVFPVACCVFRQPLKDPCGKAHLFGKKTGQGIFQKSMILENMRDLVVDEFPEIGDISVKRDDHTVFFECSEPAYVGRKDGRDKLSLGKHLGRGIEDQIDGVVDLMGKDVIVEIVSVFRELGCQGKQIFMALHIKNAEVLCLDFDPFDVFRVILVFKKRGSEKKRGKNREKQNENQSFFQHKESINCPDGNSIEIWKKRALLK